MIDRERERQRERDRQRHSNHQSTSCPSGFVCSGPSMEIHQYTMWPFVSESFHMAQRLHKSSLSWHLSIFYSFMWPSPTPLYGCPTSCLCIPLWWPSGLVRDRFLFILFYFIFLDRFLMTASDYQWVGCLYTIFTFVSILTFSHLLLLIKISPY